MNSTKVILSLVCATLSTAAFAAPAVARTTTRPVPVSVVHPVNLPRSAENATVEIALTIDAAGVPHNIQCSGHIPENVFASVAAAVAQWRFAPATVNGQPVSQRVILPVTLLDGDEHIIARDDRPAAFDQ